MARPVFIGHYGKGLGAVSEFAAGSGDRKRKNNGDSGHRLLIVIFDSDCGILRHVLPGGTRGPFAGNHHNVDLGGESLGRSCGGQPVQRHQKAES